MRVCRQVASSQSVKRERVLPNLEVFGARLGDVFVGISHQIKEAFLNCAAVDEERPSLAKHTEEGFVMQKRVIPRRRSDMVSLVLYAGGDGLVSHAGVVVPYGSHVYLSVLTGVAVAARSEAGVEVFHEFVDDIPVDERVHVDIPRVIFVAFFE